MIFKAIYKIILKERGILWIEKEFADRFLKTEHDWEYYENLYPERDLDEKAIVTRYAPSPTGFVHLGALYAAFIARKMAKQK